MTAPIRGLRVSLYTKSKPRRFGAMPGVASLDSLAEHLQTLDNNTSLRTVFEPAELQMDPAARMFSDGFQFTAAAFRQAAQIVSPGLSKFLPELAGMVTSADDERMQLVDGSFALAIWNSMIDLRFSCFKRYRIIRNETERTIEGFVSYKHQYLENITLYRQAVDTLASHDPNVLPYAALLTGRRFALWFRHTTPTFVLNVDEEQWPFHGGYYFTNGEATGTSVRGTLAVFTPKGVCLGPYRKHGRRVTHVGRDFSTRITDMFRAVVSSEVPWDKIEAGANLMVTKLLGFTADSSPERRKERAKKVAHSLALLGVQKNLALEATDVALTMGRHHEAVTTEWSQVHQLYASRTILDLFVPLLSIARRIDLARREKIEQAAFDLLMGRLLM